MNKQLMLLAALMGMQASVQAVDVKLSPSSQVYTSEAPCVANWVPNSLFEASAQETVSVVPVAANASVTTSTFEYMRNALAGARSWLSKQHMPTSVSTTFTSMKNGLVSGKDATVAFVTSFNRPTVESTKNFAIGLKNSTIATASNAYEGIKTNAPVYFDAAKNYAAENPGKVTAAVAASFVTIYALVKAVKYVRNNTNSDQFDQYKDNVKGFFARS